MRSRTVVLLGIFCLLGLASAFGQGVQSDMVGGFPAASQTDVNCSGFIAGQDISKDVYLFNGADDDDLSYVRSWLPGEHVFLRSRSGANIAVGAEYSLVRPAGDILRGYWYSGQGASIRSLGKPYENLGRAKVIRTTPDGAVAEITSACKMISRGAIAIPVVNNPIPPYTLSPLDRYAPSAGKLMGAITAGVDNTAFFGGGSLVFINLGTSDGVAVGQKFHVFHILNDEPAGAMTLPPSGPRQTTGELIVLSVDEKSSLAIIKKSTREIKLGDGIEQE